MIYKGIEIKKIVYKGFEIQEFIEGGYTIFFEGDEIYADTIKEMKEIIDELTA